MMFLYIHTVFETPRTIFDHHIIVGFMSCNTYFILTFCFTVIIIVIFSFLKGAKMAGHPHSQSQPKGHAGRAVMSIIDKYYEESPGFQDIFDEDSFYIFAVVFTLASCLMGFVASRYIKLKCRDD